MEEKRLTSKRIFNLAITVVCAAVALLYFYTAKEGQLPIYQQRGILVAVGFTVIFVTRPMFKGKRTWWTICIDAALSAATVFAIGYMPGHASISLDLPEEVEKTLAQAINRRFWLGIIGFIIFIGGIITGVGVLGVIGVQ